MSAHHDTHEPSDPVEAVVKHIPIIIPAAGAVLIFLLAFIAVFMARSQPAFTCDCIGTKARLWRVFSFDRHDVQGLRSNQQLDGGSSLPLTFAHHLARQLQSDSLTSQTLRRHGA